MKQVNKAALALMLVLGSTAAWAEEIGNLVVSAASPAGAGTAAQGNQFLFQTSRAYVLKIDWLQNDLFRLQVASKGQFTAPGNKAAPIVIKTAFAPVAIERREMPDYILLKSASLALRLYKKPLRLALYRADNQTMLWQEIRPLDISKHATEQTLASDAQEQFFGGGQQNGQFAFKGKNLEISYSGGWEENDRPSPAPFYMSSRGYGVLRHSWADGSYDFRSRDYTTTRHKEARFDAYYFAGNSIREVLARYTDLTGRAPLLPRWGYEFGDADCYNDADNSKKPGTVPAGWSDGPTGKTPDVIQSVAAKYREHDMPGGWILPNDGYGCGYTDLQKVVSGLQQYGFKTGLWTENGVDKIAWEVGQAGTRAQKLDVAWTGQGYQFSLDANQAAANGITQNSDARPFIWTVMGWAGTQRYAVTWTGDQSGSWDYIRWHIPTLIGSGLSGQTYATGDVDGIFGGSPETYTRDLQWKAFTPVLMGMSGWSKNERKHPWWFDEPYRSINRDYLKLKMRLMPYMYTLAYQAEQTGAPIVRGLMWDHPDDPHAFGEDYKYQFFLGQDLLVAPVYTSQAANRGWRRGVYLPEGQWIDYWDGRVTDAPKAGTLLDYPVTLDKLPLLVRAGAIIPMAKPQLYDGQVVQDELTLDMYPHGESTFTLYEDDGTTRAYRTGAQRLQRFAMSAAPGGPVKVQIDGAKGIYAGMLRERTYVLQVHARTPVQGVQLNARALPAHASRAAWQQAASGWFYDAEDKYGTLYVKTATLPVDQAQAITIDLVPGAAAASTPPYPAMPAASPWLTQDQVQVLNRPQEEPGHPLENALDDDGQTWFRTKRDQTLKTGPHEFVLALGERRLIAGFEIAPRTDENWKYGQVRDYELYLSDKNGEWGEPVKRGQLKRQQGSQRVEFPPQAGSLLRFRMLSVHSGDDEPVANVGSDANADTASAVPPTNKLGIARSSDPKLAAFQALQVDAVPPVTISSFHILPARLPDRPAQQTILSDAKPSRQSNGRGAIRIDQAGANQPQAMRMNGVHFKKGLGVNGNSRIDYALQGHWQRLRADVGIDDACRQQGGLVFQVFGDDKLLYSSGVVQAPAVVKPELDIRGVHVLSLRTVPVAGDAGLRGKRVCGNWANPVLLGLAGDRVGE